MLDNHKKQISVIVPVYNAERYLHRCVDSIINQTFTDFELILVNDGSTDRSGTICDEYAKKYPDGKCIVIHQKNRGVSSARNTGIDWAFEHSSSQWIHFVDSDDWIHVQMLETLINAVHKHNTSVSMCEYERTSDNSIVTERKEIPESQKVSVEDIWAKEPLVCALWGKLYKKNCFENIRFPEEKCYSEDEYVVYRLLFPLSEIAFVPAKLYYYYRNNDSATAKTWTQQRLDAIEIKKEFLNYLRKNRFMRAYKKEFSIYALLIGKSYSDVKNSKNQQIKEI